MTSYAEDENDDAFQEDHDGGEEERFAATTASTKANRKAHLSVVTSLQDLTVYPEIDEEDNQEGDDENDDDKNENERAQQHRHLHLQEIADTKNLDAEADLDELSIEQEQQPNPSQMAPRTPEHPADMGNHIPDGVVPGTAEAGKKGTNICSACWIPLFSLLGSLTDCK